MANIHVDCRLGPNNTGTATAIDKETFGLLARVDVKDIATPEGAMMACAALAQVFEKQVGAIVKPPLGFDPTKNGRG